MGEAFKWKIAFHLPEPRSGHQDIFKRHRWQLSAAPRVRDMAAPRRRHWPNAPPLWASWNLGVRSGEAWSQKNLAIWKFSHGNPPVFTDAERLQFRNESLAVMDRNTNAPAWRLSRRENSGDFAEAPVGTLFFSATATVRNDRPVHR